MSIFLSCSVLVLLPVLLCPGPFFGDCERDLQDHQDEAPAQGGPQPGDLGGSLWWRCLVSHVTGSIEAIVMVAAFGQRCEIGADVAPSRGWRGLRLFDFFCKVAGQRRTAPPAVPRMVMCCCSLDKGWDEMR